MGGCAGGEDEAEGGGEGERGDGFEDDEGVSEVSCAD